MSKRRDNERMDNTPSKAQMIQRAIAGMKTVYPVGRRPPAARTLFCLAALTAATLVPLGPTRQVSDQQPVQVTSPAADAVASESKAAGMPEEPSTAIVEKQEQYPLPVATAVRLADQVAADSFVELGALDSTPGEAFDPFLVRVAQAMDSFTSITGHEVCGVIMQSEHEDAWRVRLTTNRSHIGCVMVSFDEPGFRRYGTDIHSHPRLPGGATVNAQDVMRRPDFHCGMTALVFDETFSGQDLSRGPGYLVSRNRLLYQNGADKPFRQLATFETLDTPPELALRQTASPAVPGQEAAAAAWANEDQEGIPATRCPAPETLTADEPTDRTRSNAPSARG